ncbi:M23 family metallopeptidase [Candidatus Poribacteria bacterium]|nr:M23 family metallopeptidase [Candidatus Poribacteria bacterium]
MKKRKCQICMYAFVACALGFLLFVLLYNPSTASIQDSLLAAADLPEASPPEMDIFVSTDPMTEAEISEELRNLNEQYQLQARSTSPSVKIETYYAKNGDNLWDIARKYNLDWFTILSVNKLKKANDISIGQELKIPNQDGVLHTVQAGETLEDIALKYRVQMNQIVGANRIINRNQMLPGKEIFIPGAKMTLKEQHKLTEDRGIKHDAIARPKGKAIISPLKGKITSRFGYRIHPISCKYAFHKGVDISARYGTPVKAVMDGRVTFSGWMGGYGKLVVIKHPNGWITRYGHNSQLLVKEGDWVVSGKIIAKVGSTGRSTGNHLHFETWKGDELVNPSKSPIPFRR